MRTVTSDPVADRELARRLLEDGDELAFRTLYQRHAPALHALIRRYMGGDSADADDVLQETWIRATRSMASFRWASSLRTWLSGIAINQARDAIRRNTRRKMVGPESLERIPARSADPTLGMQLEGALGALPDGYRTILLLHDWQGFSHVEISQSLDIAVGTSRSQLHHARRALRELLGGGPEEAMT